MEKEVRECTRKLIELYLEKRDVYGVFSLLDENITWIGTADNDISHNIEEVKSGMLQEKKSLKTTFRVVNTDYRYQSIDDNAGILSGSLVIEATDENNKKVQVSHRLSAVCVKKDNQVKFVHLHVSEGDLNLAYEKYFVMNKNKIDNKKLRMKVKERETDLYSANQQISVIMQNIPGGISELNHDKEISVIRLSDGFLEMFGYTRSDIKKRFNDSFLAMIYEGDRKRVASTIQHSGSSTNPIELEYRILCKNGSLMWVIDRGRLVKDEEGKETFFSIVLDITQRKEEEEKLRLMLQRHQVIMNQATDIIFEWDILKDSIEYSANWIKKFGYIPIYSNISNEIPLSSNIYKDDLLAYTMIRNDVLAGKEYSEAEIRICDHNQIFKWYRIRVTTQFSRDDKPIKAIGIISDIDKEKISTIALLNAAQRDPLTNIYNKIAVQSKIEAILNRFQKERHALFIIDIDNFKEVNDKFGHQGGDIVLILLAKKLDKIFGKDNIVGRIGGDEFVAFVRDVKDIEDIKTKAEAVVNAFANGEAEFKNLSCSVGVALAYQDASQYRTLIHCSDSALYYVKNNGKKGYTFYQEFMGVGVPYTMMKTLVDEANDKDGIESTLVQYAFKLLYKTTNTLGSIQQILGTLGHTYDVSKVYIFENSKDNLYTSNTFEWHNDHTKKQMDELQHLSYKKELNGFMEQFDEHGIFYCQNTDLLNNNLKKIFKTQGISSVLQCLMFNENECIGFIGFDELEENRFWTSEQMQTLSLITSIIATFLIKYRLIQGIKDDK
ncbi:MAG: diguanylate cyclase [Erysipelotrichaceae bacterium]